MMESQERVYFSFRGPFDPCPPVPFKTYVVPPNQFINFHRRADGYFNRRIRPLRLSVMS
ncbi:hypothetical protein PRIO_2218 [Paenibacillus riograndensis SBR5]|uniref:Uncharacterized protein n=1 Tax=Paenibacillus riograndensis SBR5 TaxID=1073571 RepID=A0A0E4HCM4_9BACL|nr:hypothetical protein PRIO_2218 [Paenibacillus riograndensis SBR5]